jgi:hypothetical protein
MPFSAIKQFQPDNRIRPKAFQAGHQISVAIGRVARHSGLVPIFPLVATRVSTIAFVYRSDEGPSSANASKEMGCLSCVFCRSSS